MLIRKETEMFQAYIYTFYFTYVWNRFQAGTD